MILKALADFYEVLAKQGRIEQDGWLKKPVGWEICLDENGQLTQIVSLKQKDEKNKLRQQKMAMPDWGNSAGSAIRSSFLCNNSSYFLGLSEKDSSERLKNKLVDCQKLHHSLLDDIDRVEVKAVLAFLDWMSAGGKLPDDIFAGLDKSAIAGDNYIFSVNGIRLHEIADVRSAWDKFYMNLETNAIGVCLVTGDKVPIVDKHPLIKGLYGVKGAGAGLSNYNCPSFCSFGKEQNLNAPVGKHTAYAYTSALTYLLSNKLYSKAFGEDLTLVWWSEDADDKYAEFQCAAAFGDESRWSDADISGILDALSAGRPTAEFNPNRKFYVMGISANSSRIIVRFFIENSFGAMMQNVKAHYDRLQITQPQKDVGKILTVGRLFRAMVRENVNEELHETVINKMFQSILFGHTYPTQMLHMTMRRLRVGDTVNWQRIAIIKAYFLRFLPKNDKRKECFTMSLNTENNNPAYVLGRLFAMYEALQYRALQKDTIHTSYFGSAISTPGIVFPRLAKLSQIYLQKLPEGAHVWYDKQIMDLKARINGIYPMRFNLVEQGIFDMGYYHQREWLFTKHTDDENTNNNADITAESEN